MAMGTRIDISVMSCSAEHAALATRELEQSMLRWSKDWYPWGTLPGELKQLNAAFASGKAMRVSPELRDLLTASKRLSDTSEGYFDPAVAPMVKAWGFDDMNRPRRDLPQEQLLVAWASSHPSIQDVIIEATQVSSKRSDVQLDLGAIAKGYALDLSLDLLKQRGITDAAINIGGQLRAVGAMGEPLRPVQIRDPRLNASLASLVLKTGESISTSGDYERYVIINGQPIHHLLDPHSGRPVAATQMVTVVADSATLADAASTAIMAAGSDWQRIAKELGIAQVVRIDSTGKIDVTAALYPRLHWRPTALQTHQLVQVK